MKADMRLVALIAKMLRDFPVGVEVLPTTYLPPVGPPETPEGYKFKRRTKRKWKGRDNVKAARKQRKATQ